MTEKELEKQAKLESLQNQHRKLLLERLPLQTAFKKSSKETEKHRQRLAKKSAEIKSVGEQIFHMKHEGETPHVTDHALVRYLERVEGVDIWALKEKVASNKNAVREGNVVVTVNEDLTIS